MPKLKLVNKKIISPSLFEVSFDATNYVDTFTKPGQYCVVSIPESKPMYLVLSNCIGDLIWTFLVRDSNASSSSLLKLDIGVSLEISEPQGNGYPLDKLSGKDIILFSAGTGLASFNSVLREISKNRTAFKKVVLLHGSRIETEIPFRNEMLEWQKSQIDVFLTLSQPDEKWLGHKGYVQEILDLKKIDLEGYCGLICGPMAMVEDAIKIASKHGLKPEWVYSNY